MENSIFHLTILEAGRRFYDGDCVSLVIPSSDGLYGIMAHHTNFFSALATGIVKFTLPDKTVKKASVANGICKVEDGQVLILTDSAELPEEIDIKRAEREAAEAKEEMLRKKSVNEYHLAESQLARALNRIRLTRYNSDIKRP